MEKKRFRCTLLFQDENMPKKRGYEPTWDRAKGLLVYWFRIFAATKMAFVDDLRENIRYSYLPDGTNFLSLDLPKDMQEDYNG